MAPEGWIIPSDTAWNILTTTLDPNAFDWEDTTNVAGGLLKSTGTIEDGTGLWYAPNQLASNVTGFSANPAGKRWYNGASSDLGEAGYWWSSSPDSQQTAMLMYIYNWGGHAGISDGFRYNGLSVRCIRD